MAETKTHSDWWIALFWIIAGAAALWPLLKDVGPVPSVAAALSIGSGSKVAVSDSTFKTSGQIPPELIEIRPDNRTDESEFLLYTYRKLRGELPSSLYNRSQILADLSQLRNRVNRFSEYIKARSIDSNILALYAGLLAAIDDYDHYLVQLDRIDRTILAQSQIKSAESGYNAGLAGGYAAGEAYRNGQEGGDVALAGVAAGMVTLIFESIQNQQVLDESKRRAFEDASNEFRRSMSVIEARETNLLAEFAEKYHWRKSAKSWDDSFSQLESELFDEYSKATNPAQAVAASTSILRAARKIPVAPIYDSHRAYALYWAARGVTWAAERGLGAKKWGLRKSPSAETAVTLWDEALRYAGADDSGELRSQRAWALGIGGHFPDALRQAGEVFSVRQNDATFLYEYVSLWAASGNADKTGLANLQVVLAHGSFSSELDSSKQITIKTIRSDPNLEALQQAHSLEFAELTKVKYRWYINPGIFSDDICIVNDSAFPLTKVQFDVTVKSVGEKDWGPFRFETARIDPGQTFTWNTKIDRRDKRSSTSAILAAEESDNTENP